MKLAKELLSINLRVARDRLGLTQASLAEKARVSQQMVQKIEARKTAPTPETLDSLAKALGTTVSALFADADVQASINPRGLLSAADLSRAVQGIVQAGPARQIFLLYIATGDQTYFDRLDEDTRQVLANIDIA